MSETRYVCPPGSDVTSSMRCGVACASGALSAEICVQVAQACADGRLSAQDCAGLEGDAGPMDLGGEDQGDDAGPDEGVVDLGVDAGPCGMPCSGDTPLCDSDSGECVACLSAGDCGGDTPVCHPSTRLCVECAESGDCSGDTPACFNGECVGCIGNADCGPTQPVCDTNAKVCGDCSGRVGCLGRPATPACDLSTGACIECDVPNESADCGDTPSTPRCLNGACRQCRDMTSTIDCTSPTTSVCSGGSCVACSADAHCTHLVGLPRCVGSRCVACRPASEATDCGSQSCNPATLTCSGTTRGSRFLCESCVSDSDCSQSTGVTRCVPMHYQGEPRGGYCLEEAGSCERPFLTPIMAASLSGATITTYCGIDQSAVSCDAVVALQQSRQCPSGDPDECNAEGALCATVGLAVNHCTYACGNPNDCLPNGNGSTCNAGYCGS